MLEYTDVSGWQSYGYWRGATELRRLANAARIDDPMPWELVEYCRYIIWYTFCVQWITISHVLIIGRE